MSNGKNVRFTFSVRDNYIILFIIPCNNKNMALRIYNVVIIVTY